MISDEKKQQTPDNQTLRNAARRGQLPSLPPKGYLQLSLQNTTYSFRPRNDEEFQRLLNTEMYWEPEVRIEEKSIHPIFVNLPQLPARTQELIELVRNGDDRLLLSRNRPDAQRLEKLINRLAVLQSIQAHKKDHGHQPDLMFPSSTRVRARTAGHWFNEGALKPLVGFMLILTFTANFFKGNITAENTDQAHDYNPLLWFAGLLTLPLVFFMIKTTYHYAAMQETPHVRATDSDDDPYYNHHAIIEILHKDFNVVINFDKNELTSDLLLRSDSYKNPSAPTEKKEPKENDGKRTVDPLNDDYFSFGFDTPEASKARRNKVAAAYKKLVDASPLALDSVAASADDKQETKTVIPAANRIDQQLAVLQSSATWQCRATLLTESIDGASLLLTVGLPKLLFNISQNPSFTLKLPLWSAFLLAGVGLGVFKGAVGVLNYTNQAVSRHLAIEYFRTGDVHPPIEKLSSLFATLKQHINKLPVGLPFLMQLFHAAAIVLSNPLDTPNYSKFIKWFLLTPIMMLGAAVKSQYDVENALRGAYPNSPHLQRHFQTLALKRHLVLRNFMTHEWFINLLSKTTNRVIHASFATLSYGPGLFMIAYKAFMVIANDLIPELPDNWRTPLSDVVGDLSQPIALLGIPFALLVAYPQTMQCYLHTLSKAANENDEKIDYSQFFISHDDNEPKEPSAVKPRTSICTKISTSIAALCKHKRWHVGASSAEKQPLNPNGTSTAPKADGLNNQQPTDYGSTETGPGV